MVFALYLYVCATRNLIGYCERRREIMNQSGAVVWRCGLLLEDAIDYISGCQTFLSIGPTVESRIRPRGTSYQSWLTIITKYDCYTALLRNFEKKTWFFSKRPEKAPRAIFEGLTDHFLPSGRRLRTTELQLSRHDFPRGPEKNPAGHFWEPHGPIHCPWAIFEGLTGHILPAGRSWEPLSEMYL